MITQSHVVNMIFYFSLFLHFLVNIHILLMDWVSRIKLWIYTICLKKSIQRPSFGFDYDYIYISCKQNIKRNTEKKNSFKGSIIVTNQIYYEQKIKCIATN